MFMDLTQEDISVRLGILFAVHVVVYVWTRYIVAPARVGWPRVVRFVPLLPALLLTTTLFDSHVVSEFTPAIYCLINFNWLTFGKILAFCCNRGQLTKSYDSGSTAAFVLSCLFPINVAFREKRVDASENASKERHAYRDVRFSVIHLKGSELYYEAGTLVLRIIAKLCLIGVAGYGYFYFDKAGHEFWRRFCLTWVGYGNTSGVEDVVAMILLFGLNLKLDDNFDYPWLSKSISEFWSRRYNLVFGVVLKNMAHDPIHEGSWVRGKKYFERNKPSYARKSAAIMACFVLSGVYHVAVLWFGYSTGFVFLHGLFFVVNGLAVVLEGAVKLWLLKSGHYKWIPRSVPSWAMTAYTLVTLTVMAHYLMWPEVIETGYAEKFVTAALANLKPFGLDIAP